MKKPTYAQLARQLLELEAQSLWRLKEAKTDMPKASDEHLMASACVISITALGGRQIVAPFAITDGLSKETVDALIKEIDKTMTQYGYPVK